MSQRKFDFYVVPTPIGNIQDITFRALETLQNVDFIACEDTRTTQKLLNHYNIKTKCISYHKYNERERVEFFLHELSLGKSIALVSDAGTPMICDPGGVIIEEIKKKGFTVTSLPGASAITTFLAQVPRDSEEFMFIGFIPRTEAQISAIVQKYAGLNMLFYDSPARILKTLNVIQKTRGRVKIALGRELSKLFEEVIIDEISSVIEHFKDGIKGEIICMVYADNHLEISDITSKIEKLRDKGFKDKEIVSILTSLFNLNKNDVYKVVLKNSERE